jgi:putative hydrolase of the HAD superfamily
VSAELFPAAFAEGERFLDGSPTTPKRADYHRRVLSTLGVTQPTTMLLDELEASPTEPVVEVFPDVRPILDTLYSAGVPMGVVSDNWAGLDAVYRSLDLERYFVGFVISEVLGCRKPDARMFVTGSELLGLDPSACLVVDDDPGHVAGAIGLGYHGVALVRAGVPPASVPTIRSLAGIPPLVAGVV